MVTDTKGGNDLTDVNTVAEETGDFQEGACCANMERTNEEYYYITDANLDAGFPLKNGDATKIISVCAWFKLEAIGDAEYHMIWSKYDRGDNKRSLAILCHRSGSTYTIEAWQGHTNGTAAQAITLFTVNPVGIWMHLGFTYRDDTKAWTARLYNDNTGLPDSNGGTATNNINVEDANVGVGCSYNSGSAEYFFDGLLDEVVVFKDILSEAEIDDIRNQAYGT